MMVNWEFFDDLTPGAATELVDQLRAGNEVQSRPAARRLCTWREAERVLAGFTDGRADEGVGGRRRGLAAAAGWTASRQRAPAWSAPPTRPPDREAADAQADQSDDRRRTDHADPGALRHWDHAAPGSSTTYERTAATRRCARRWRWRRPT